MKNKKMGVIKLNIGCGDKKREGFLGIDIDENSKADIIASATAIPFDDNVVDEIYTANMIEHLTPAEAKKFFSEVTRVLKRGGKFVAKFDVGWSRKHLLGKDPTHKHRYSTREIKKIISSFPFSCIDIRWKIYWVNKKDLLKFQIKNVLFSKIFINLIK